MSAPGPLMFFTTPAGWWRVGRAPLNPPPRFLVSPIQFIVSISQTPVKSPRSRWLTSTWLFIAQAPAVEMPMLIAGTTGMASAIALVGSAEPALCLLWDRPQSAGGIYNVVDHHPVRASACYRWLANKLERPLPTAGESPLGRKRGESNKRVSNSKLRALAWQPRYPSFVQGMTES